MDANWSAAQRVVFEPEDFDVEFDRTSRASDNCRALFAGFVGCENLIDQPEGYQQIAAGMRAREIDPWLHIPFTFVFKGPPGTGETTTAQKMGQIFYDMG